MKIMLKIVPVVILMASSLLRANGDLCEQALSKIAKGGIDATNVGNWRTDFSASSKVSLKTDAAREEDIKDTTESMLEVILEWPDTPPFELIPESGAKFDLSVPWDAHKSIKAEVTGSAIQNGIIKATVLLPVSGHTGVPNARAWSTTDTFSIIHEDSSGKKTTLAKDIKSKALVTALDVEFPVEQNKVVKLYYIRSGSDGPNGYIGGRVMEITYK